MEETNQVSGGVFDAVCAMADRAAEAQRALAKSTTDVKNGLLAAIADALDARADEIAAANALDMSQAFDEGMDAGKLDRLKFDVPRIAASAQDMRYVATLPDPVGQVVRGFEAPNGLRLQQVRVPMGVIGMIYEARPNVTVDVVSLCIKSGNAALLRGGHAAERTNAATLAIVKDVLAELHFDAALVDTVDPYGREGATALMEARGHVDLLVPRGSARLIQAVVRNSKVPVIETGAGNVHIYVDRSADLTKAIPILLNAKTQRVGVCNAAEKLIVHRDVAEAFLPMAAQALANAHVAIHADEVSYRIIGEANIRDIELLEADASDWGTEYLALEIGVRVVDSIDDAIAHINTYSTHHTARSNASRKTSTPPSSWSTPRPASPTAVCSASAPNWASRRRRCTRAGPWGCRR